MIYLIGAGAIGKALAVLLKAEGKEVSLVRGSVDNIDPYLERIRVQNRAHPVLEAEIPITTLSNLPSIDGVVVIATKAFSNAVIAKKLEQKSGDFSVVILQNGLNIEKPFSGLKEVYRCVLMSTSQVLESGLVSFKSVGPSPVGRIYGDPQNLEKVINQINTKEFAFRIEEDILPFVWEKVMLNCAYNSICPLIETDNGIFHRDSEVHQLGMSIVRECIALAEAYGVHLDINKVEEKLLFISQRANGQIISTFEDLRKGRPTEINSLNLEIKRLSEAIGKPYLTPKTSMLGEIIDIKSRLSRKD